MKTIKLLAMTLSIGALLACGGKNKKGTTASDGDGSGTGTGKSSGSKGDTGLAQPDMSGKDPNLQEIVYFAFDSSDLDEAARAKLEENASWLKADGKRTLTIEGHTDEVGTPEYNLGLGERRAQTSRDYLLRLGIEANRVSIITFGEEKPAGSEDSQNRRSVFIATKKQ